MSEERDPTKKRGPCFDLVMRAIDSAPADTPGKKMLAAMTREVALKAYEAGRRDAAAIVRREARGSLHLNEIASEIDP